MAEQRNGTRPGPAVANRAPGSAHGATTEQLRADIDSGRTRDKVDHPDPATAPLGTDAEAGGAAPSPQAVAADRNRPDDRRSRGPGDDPVSPPGGRRWLIWVLVAAVLIAGIALYAGLL